MAFSLFKKSQKYNIPEDYKNFLSQKEFDEVVDLSLHHLEQLDFKVKDVEGGKITIKQEEDDDRYFFLDNLVRKIAQLEKELWSDEIIAHFTKLQDRSDAYNFLYKDFEHAVKYLKVLIKADDLIPNSEEYVTRVDFKDTLTFLVFDFEDQFHYIRCDNAKEWDETNDQLFEVALDNISNEDIDIKEYEYEEQFQVFILFSGDFASSFIIELERNVPFAIGEFGTLIAIPTKGSAFIHPISTDNIIELVHVLYPQIEEFYNEDTGNINLEFYWFNRGQFQIFPKIKNEDGTITISLPNELSDTLGQ